MLKDTPDVIRVIQPEMFMALMGFIATQAIALIVIVWKGGRWTSRIEGELQTLRGSFDKHIGTSYADLKLRLQSIENYMRDKGSDK